MLLFGHSLSGVLAEYLFNDYCETAEGPAQSPPENLTDPAVTEEIIQQFQCERYAKSNVPPSVHIRGIVNFEGFSQASDIRVTPNRFMVEIYSGFYDENVDQFFAGKDFGGRVALVRIGSANHYGPNNFVEQNENQRPVCMRVRPPPEDTYLSTQMKQRRILRSIAATVVRAYRGIDQIGRLQRKRHLEVDNVTLI